VVLGLNLATAGMQQLPSAGSRWPLGREFADAYIAWNMNVVTMFTDTYLMFTKLLIPAVGCTDFDFSSGETIVKQQNADLWLLARAVALRLTMVSYVRRKAATAEKSHTQSVPMTPLYSLSEQASRSWANISAGHSVLAWPATCGIHNSLQALLEELYPRAGYRRMPAAIVHPSATLLSYDKTFRVDEDHLSEAPSVLEWSSNVAPSLILSTYISLTFVMLERAATATGITQSYGWAVAEGLMEIFYGVPMVLSFISHGLLSVIVFVGLLWKLGISVGRIKPSGVLNAPWRAPRQDRCVHMWIVWLSCVWSFIHHNGFTMIKLAMTFDGFNNRPCSQPLLLLLFMVSVNTMHLSFGIGRLAHMTLLPETWTTRADLLLCVGFAGRVLSGACIATLSHPASPTSRGDTPYALLYDRSWSWTHSEWFYIMVCDLVWCVGSILLRAGLLLYPRSPKAKLTRRAAARQTILAQHALANSGLKIQANAELLARALDFDGTWQLESIPAKGTEGDGSDEDFGGGLRAKQRVKNFIARDDNSSKAMAATRKLGAEKGGHKEGRGALQMMGAFEVSRKLLPCQCSPPATALPPPGSKLIEELEGRSARGETLEC